MSPPAPFLYHSCSQPLTDETQDPRITAPMLDEAHEPLVVDGVEVPTNVRVEYPVHLLALDGYRHGVQRMVLAAERQLHAGEM